MMFLAVSYHYIGSENKYSNGVYPVSTERLENQLKELGRFMSFIGQKDILAALEGGRALPERSCVITFDDALRSQYEYALPILDKLGVPSIFFVIGKPYGEKRPAVVHKVQWLRAHIPPAEFLERIAKFYQADCGDQFELSALGVSDEILRSQYVYDTPDEARVKYILTKGGLSQDLRERIIDAIFKELEPDEKSFCDDFYMTATQIRDLYHRDMLGFHGYTHDPMATLDHSVLEREMSQGNKILSGIVGDPFAKFLGMSFPYGSKGTVAVDAARIASRVGIHFGFTMERAINHSLAEPLMLARLDANDIPGGKRPLFRFTETGEIEITNSRLALSRREYFKEK